MTDDPEAELHAALAELAKRAGAVLQRPPRGPDAPIVRATMAAALGLLEDLLHADQADDLAAMRHSPAWWARQIRLPSARRARTRHKAVERAHLDAAIFDAWDALARAPAPAAKADRAGIVARRFGCSAQHVRRVRRRVLAALAKKCEPH